MPAENRVSRDRQIIFCKSCRKVLRDDNCAVHTLGYPMRIRTVKPVFWANEKMSAMPDFTRLLALALLNYADDYGFFWANPLMIRGALFPFEEDSKKIRGSLPQLVAIGYIRIGKTPDGREAGEIINFLKHQRVDKPQDSEIQPLVSFEDHSPNIPGLFDDQSQLDRKGKEGKGKDILADPGLAEKIYQAYPRKTAHLAGIKAIQAALKTVPGDRLMERTQAFATAVSKWSASDREYIPHPATWFNRGSYDDDPATWERKHGRQTDQRSSTRSFEQTSPASLLDKVGS
jgi:hypothetical protein